jgi:hypothetical protein
MSSSFITEAWKHVDDLKDVKKFYFKYFKGMDEVILSNLIDMYENAF